MKSGIQTFFLEAGESACYALDILEISSRITGRPVNVVDALYAAIQGGHIYYNEKDSSDNDNFFVKDPAGLLSRLTGQQWSTTKEGPDYVAKKGEWVVDRWERKKTGIVIGHFRLPDWDSLANSQTVRYGEIVSKRVFRRVL